MSIEDADSAAGVWDAAATAVAETSDTADNAVGQGSGIAGDAGHDGSSTPRRVVEPDLLWIESVTERLLGTAGRSPSWERSDGALLAATDNAAPNVTAAPPLGAAPAPAGADLSGPGAVPDAAAPPRAVGAPREHATGLTRDVASESASALAPTGPADDLTPRQSEGNEHWDRGGAVRPYAPPLRPREVYPPAAPVPAAATPPVDPAAAAWVAEVPLPSRLPSAHQGPVSYRSALARWASAPGADGATPSPLTAETSYFAPQQPLPPRAAADSPDRAAATTAIPPDLSGEDMAPGVLRAALRDALPDEVGRRPRPVDSIFGDPAWSLAPESQAAADVGEDPLFAPRLPPTAAAIAEDPVVPTRSAAPARTAAANPASTATRDPDRRVLVPGVDLTDPDLAPHAAQARAEQGEPGQASDDPPRSTRDRRPGGGPDGSAGRPPHPMPPAAAGGHRGRSSEVGAADIALRRAFLSGDEQLAAAVVDLVGAQGQDQQRLRLVEAYLDAVLAAGGEGLAGAQRLRGLLDS